MFRIAVVEDDAQYAKTIQNYLDRFEQEHKVAFEQTVFTDGDGILQKYESQFDLILMDIEMPLVDGMTAAREIRAVDEKVMIIFITN
ncbi:MAG: response regulator transcription factor, partial [Lachnospiraceae bacterium]|nr:response regulator transcription factor [Lachnospiraceae bacterium]